MASKDFNKPNVLFIMSDDQGAWAMGCVGNDEVKTPNLDRLAATGINFSNFFCASPVCSAARASVLTGRIPSQHGVHDWIKSGSVGIDELPEHMRNDKYYEFENTPIEYLEGMGAYTDILSDNDYLCGLSGKWHLGNSTKPQKGFSYWKALLRGGCQYYNGDVVEDGKIFYHKGYITDYITDNALEFLDNTARDNNPFYLSVHYTAPHSPWDRKNHPKEFFDMYEDCQCKSCPDEPIHPQQIKSCPIGDSPQQRKENIKGYYAAITAMDTNIGRIIDKIEQMGLRENTLIVFTSDNGMNLGHHGIWGKGNGTFPQNLFDTSVKVPFIVSRLGFVPEGKVCEELLSHYDFMPTLLEYLNMDNPDKTTLPGKSFSKILEGKDIKCRDNIVVFDEYGPVRMIRSKEYKYIHRYPYGPHEFYDLINDPSEKNNLISDQLYKESIEEMRAKMQDWFTCYADPQIDGAKEPVTGAGQIGRGGSNSKGKESYDSNIQYFESGEL